MRKVSDSHLERCLVLVTQLMHLTDRMLMECDDDSCLLLCAILRDSAYQIRRAVERYRNQL